MHLGLPAALLADQISDIISAAIPIILLAIWTINTLMSGRNQQQNRTANRPRPDPTSRRLPNRPPGERASLEMSPGALRPSQRELDRFLEEVTGRRRSPAESVPPGVSAVSPRPPVRRRPEPEPVQVVRPGRPAGPARTPAASPARSLSTMPSAVGSDIGRQVEDYLKDSTKLGSEVNEYVRRQLNHQVGTLTPTTPVSTAEVPDLGSTRPPLAVDAADLRALLANPPSLRRAFALTTVLSRPLCQRAGRRDLRLEP